MLKSSELRIGNWIYNPIQDLNLIVDGSLIAIEHNRERSIKNHEGFKPIPLTEEWLIKFGFEKEEDYYVYILGYDFGEIKIYPSPNGFFFIEGVIQEHIKHVHKLQNLCFVFGEELTIKE